MSDNLTAILITGMVILGPIWLTMHYAYKFKTGRRAAAQSDAAHEVLSEMAARMEARMATLERILDAQAPGWRQHEDAGGMEWR